MIDPKRYYQVPSEHKKALIGTFVFHALVVGVLFLLILKAPVYEAEEGILVNFGLDDSGFGMIEPSSQGAALPQVASAPPSNSSIGEESILTQNFEDAPSVPVVDTEAERLRQEQIEAERAVREQEERERQRVAEERRRQEEIANRTREALAAGRNVGTNSNSEGVAWGEGNQGSPNGSIESTNRGEGSGRGNSGISYDLGGRGVVTLPLPNYNYQGEGRVVVEVRVDRNGRVIQAIPGRQGTTTAEEYLHNAAREAALKTVFDPTPNAASVQIGTITYNFKLN